MRLATVILDIPTQALDAPYTYVVPEDGPDAAGDLPIEVGCAVVVPFGHRQAVGFVMGIADYGEDDLAAGGRLPAGLGPAKLKGIVRAVSRPYFDEEGAACAQFLAKRYIAPLSSCVRLFTPPGGVPRMVRANGYWRLEEPAVGEVDDRWAVPGEAFDGFAPRKGAVKQEAIVEALRAGELRLSELAAEFGSVSGALKSLEAKGVVRIERRRRMRGMGVPPACRPAEWGDAAASRGTRSHGDTGGSRSEVRVAPAIPAISGTTETLADSLRQPATDTGATGGAASAETLCAPSLQSLDRRSEAHEAEGRAAERGVSKDAVAFVAPAVGAFVPSPRPELTAGQAAALAAIDAARERAAGEVVLVDGVTGSGKTEVYLQAIEHVLAAGRTACVLVPEISLTPQTVARFRGRFGNTVAVMHSRMSAGERYDQWDFIRSGAARVVVGARSALFTPLANLGLIVIDEEHEGSYKQDSAPRYVSRDVAVWMARRAGAAVVLGSATPSVEALHACAKDPAWHRVELPERANRKPLPDIQVVDMAREFSGGHRSMFSRPLAAALEEELGAGRKAVLLLNQRGFAKFLLCRDCGFVPECPSCSTSLTFHERGNLLVCHHCGRREAAPPVCPKCGSPYLRKFGAGTQRVEDELRALVAGFGGAAAGALVVRMDADTTGGKGAHQRLLEQFAAADAAVLLGTQMIAKGLDFDDVTLVGVINADTMLQLPDYRASERTFDLIEQVAGRAGRADLPGRVFVQTYDAQAVPIRAAAAYDRAAFLRDELPKRRLLGYPPYVRLANVLVWGKGEPAVRAAAAELEQALSKVVRDMAGESWTVLPATPCVLAKLRGTYRWHIVVKCPPEDDLSGILEPLFRARKADPNVNVAVDVDPADLL